MFRRGLLIPAFAMGSMAAAAPMASAVANDSADPSRPALDSLRRVVERFDFEPADGVHRQFPAKFRRYVASDQGYPGFGTILLSDEAAAEGDWSLRFSLEGGSLQARVPPGLIEILPLRDYLLSAQVRTAGLQHARARVVAWMTDKHGAVIPASRCEGPLIETGGAWQQVSVPILGDFAEAADIVVALEVLQPRQFLAPDADPDRPALEDVRGEAWFDEVTLWQLPRVELSTDSPVNVVAAPALPMLHLTVDDLAREPLRANLVMRDWRGDICLARSFDVPSGGARISIDLRDFAMGWYEAEVEVDGPGGVIGTRRLQFVRRASISSSEAAATRHFAADVSAAQLTRPDEVAALLRHLGVGHARLGIPVEAIDLGSHDASARRRALEQIADAHEQVTLIIERLPEHLAQALDVSAEQVVLGLSGDERVWRSQLEPSLAEWSHLTRRWQLGTGRAGAPTMNGIPSAIIDRAAAAFSSVVAAPSLSIPWPVEREPSAGPSKVGHDLVIGHEIHPASIAAYVTSWPISGTEPIATLEPLPVDDYPPANRIADLMIRALHARRAGLDQLSIAAPWTLSDERRPRFMPDALYGPWATLAEQIGGRQVVGDFPAPSGLRCWILEEKRTGSAALAAWNESAPGDESRLVATLADGPVEVIDAFGNRRPVPLIDGKHQVDLGPVPVFIEGVDLALARFVASIQISPTTIPSTHRVHELELSLENPWKVHLFGSVRASDPEIGEVSPRSQEFNIPAGRSVRLPVSLLLNAGAINGRHDIALEFDLTTDERRSFITRASLDVGVPTLEASPTWTVARNPVTGELDLLIMLHVANRGDRPVNLDIALTAPGVSQKRRLIAGLVPGQSAVRHFPVPGGAALLAGRRVRLSVEDHDGGGRLNQALDIPEIVQAASRSGETSGERRVKEED